MFHCLCGDESLKNMVFLTTKWDKASPSFAQKHEEELKNNFWSTMINLGCSQPKRLGGVATQSSGIVDPVSDVILPMLKYQPRWLEIQRELGSGNLLSDTTAGQKVHQDLSSQMEKMQEDYKLTMIQSEKSHEATIKAALVNQAEQYSNKFKEYEAERKALEATYERVMKEREEEYKNMANEVRRLKEKERRREINEIRCTQEEKERREREEKERKEWTDKMWRYGVNAVSGAVVTVVTAGGYLLYA